MGSLTNSLFLLEFVVGEVSIPDCPEHSVEYVFRFLGHIVGISEKDFPRTTKAHKGGKSCIFGLSDEQAKKIADDFKIEVYVLRKYQDGDRVIMGSIKISITQMFGDIIDCVRQRPYDTPISQTVKDTYRFRVKKNGVLRHGHMTVYLRLSALGGIVVTQFQRGADQSFFFRCEDGPSSMPFYECKMLESNKNTNAADKKVKTVMWDSKNRQQHMKDLKAVLDAQDIIS